jgi:hypothetical protein
MNNKVDFQECPDIHKAALKGLLPDAVIRIEFVKKNGDVRILDGTVNEKFIPASPTGAHGIRTKKPNDDVVCVVDTFLNEWRSIRYDSILTMEVLFGLPSSNPEDEQIRGQQLEELENER